MRGDHFELLKGEDGLWYWYLRISNQPTAHPIARCGEGYTTKKTALSSMESARKAMKGAFAGKSPRVEHVKADPRAKWV